MKEVLQDKLENFSKALNRLKEALKEKESPLSIDGTIQRFEFTFEMAWKVLKKFLYYDGIDTKSVRECIKKAYQTDYIDNEEVWLSILEDRNLTSHIYNENQAKTIYDRIISKYIKEFEILENKLKEKLKSI